MRFRRSGGGEVRLSPVATSRMKAHVQRYCWSSEAGGILLGRLLIQPEHVVVDDVTEPGLHDRRSRFRFFRAQRAAQTAINEAWTRSAGEVNYLGEWHTHPEDDPTPTRHDQTDWRRLVAAQRYEQDALFFVIVGRRTIRIWELARSLEVPVALALVDTESGDEERAVDADVG